MAYNRRPGLKDTKYYESGRWKCPESLSGSHYCIIGDGRVTCKYCPEIREIDERGLMEENDNDNQELWNTRH